MAILKTLDSTAGAVPSPEGRCAARVPTEDDAFGRTRDGSGDTHGWPPLELSGAIAHRGARPRRPVQTEPPAVGRGSPHRSRHPPCTERIVRRGGPPPLHQHAARADTRR